MHTPSALGRGPFSFVAVLGFVLSIAVDTSAAHAEQQRLEEHVVWHDMTLLQTVDGSSRPLRFAVGSGPTPEVFHVDSMRWADGRREVFGSGDRLLVDSAGRLLELTSRSRILDDAPVMRLVMATESLSHRLGGVRFREVENAAVYRALPPSLEVGRRLVEPVAWTRDSLGVRVVERGTRVTDVIGDTLIDGRRHWQLRDSTALERSESWLEYSYVSQAFYRLDRDAPRTRVGRSIYDPDRQLLRLRVDSVWWDAELRRSDPNGSEVSTRQRVSAVERWEVLSETDYPRRREEYLSDLRELLGANTGMVPVPTTSLQRRLRSGDPQALDSALALWFAREPTVFMPYGDGDIAWWNGAVRWERHALGAALARADTMAALRAADVLLRRQPTDSAALAFALPLVADPARALAWALPIDFALSAIYYDLLARATCDATACRLLAAYERRSEADPRLQDLAYAARFLLDPVGEHARLVARAEIGTSAARAFVRAAQGYARQSGVFERGPAPRGMDWREWWAWFGGEVADVDEGALGLHLRLTGRDLRTEALNAYRFATLDSARFTFGVLIASQAPEAITAGEVTALYAGGGALATALAHVWSEVLLGDADPAADSVAAPLLEAVLAKLLDGTDPAWEGLDPDAIRRVGGEAVLLSGRTPPSLLEAVRGSRAVVTLAEWQDRRPALPHRAIDLGTPIIAGPFVRLRVTVEERGASGGAYAYFARFVTIVLLRTPTGWRVLEMTEAVT